jgi:L-aminopeptidase/D-esterase-like protein
VGTASERIGEGITVGAVVAVNCFGDVIDWRTGETLAGARKPGGGYLNTVEAIKGNLTPTALAFTNTTIGVLATDARLSKEEANKVAQLAADGYAYAIRPTTMLDGDTLFAISTGDRRSDVSAVGAAGAEVVAEAIARAVKSAQSLFGVPAHRDMNLEGQTA